VKTAAEVTQFCRWLHSLNSAGLYPLTQFGVAGTLAPSLVKPATNSSSSSIDVIFATYWFYPAKTKAILPQDQQCIDDQMNKQQRRFDVNSQSQ